MPVQKSHVYLMNGQILHHVSNRFNHLVGYGIIPDLLSHLMKYLLLYPRIPTIFDPLFLVFIKLSYPQLLVYYSTSVKATCIVLKLDTYIIDS